MADDILPLLGHNMANESDHESESDDGENMEEEDAIILNETETGDDRQAGGDHKKESKQMTFDKSLPSAHSYLGDDMEELRGRTILDDNLEVMLPIVSLPGVVLIPGQIIPLSLFHQHTITMIKNVIEANKTFGVVASRYSIEENTHSLAAIGTTAEIYSAKEETDDRTGIATMRVKARGRQRFETIDTKRSSTGILMAKVKILPELTMPDLLLDVVPRSQCKFCCCADQQDSVVQRAVDRRGQVLAKVKMLNNRQINKFSCAYYTWWPPWVYKMYDTTFLMKKVKSELQKWNESLESTNLPNEPAELSYWVAQNLPIDDSLRLQLLSINTAVQRLRCELSIIQKCSVMCCRQCGIDLVDKNDVFSMSVEGPLGAYVNPGGYVHETLTVYKAKNLNHVGRSSTEHSWFPGYAWTIVNCHSCYSHLGWKFTATKKQLKPQKFWGLTRAALVPGLKKTEETDAEDTDWSPVM